jgi:predicted nucleic acid-binding protein
MRRTSPSSSGIVIDSNLAVWAVLPMLSRVDVLGHFGRWHREATRLFAPVLWVAESVSAIRGGLYARVISDDEGRKALDDLFDLGVETLTMNIDLCRSAIEWAGRLGQRKAYDSFYLALAEELGVEFWTADRRLASAAQQAGMSLAHWIGEADDGR